MNGKMREAEGNGGLKVEEMRSSCVDHDMRAQDRLEPCGAMCES